MNHGFIIYSNKKFVNEKWNRKEQTMPNSTGIFKNLNPTLLFVTRKICYETGISHYHDYIELTYILSGVCRYEINNKIYPVKKGDLLFINPNDTHTTIVTDQNNPPEIFAIGFSDISMTGLGMEDNTFLFNDVAPIYSCPNELSDCLENIINKILLEKANRLPGRYFYMHSCLVQIILEITRHFYKEEDNTSSYLVSNINEETLSLKGKKELVLSICEYMKEHYAEKISLEDIAANMYLSPIYISKIFKEYTGDSPINYLILVRLKKAEVLLRNSNLSIKEIASYVGYDNPYYFSKLFKKKYKISPKEYRDNQ